MKCEKSMARVYSSHLITIHIKIILKAILSFMIRLSLNVNTSLPNKGLNNFHDPLYNPLDGDRDQTVLYDCLITCFKCSIYI